MADKKPKRTKRRCWRLKEWSYGNRLLRENKNICPICKRQGKPIRPRTNYIVIDGYIPFELDHIIPISKGGTYKLSNLQMICRTCNRSKGNK